MFGLESSEGGDAPFQVGDLVRDRLVRHGADREAHEKKRRRVEIPSVVLGVLIFERQLPVQKRRDRQ